MRTRKKPATEEPAIPKHVFIKVVAGEKAGKYATLTPSGDLLIAPKAQAAEFFATDAPRRQKELQRRGFKTIVEPA